MKILVIGPSWVGDMMMSQSLYRTPRARYPRAIIDVMAPAWCRPLLSRMPEVNEAIPMPLGHGALEIGERRKLGHSLREKALRPRLRLTKLLQICISAFLRGYSSSHWLARRDALRFTQRCTRAR